MCVHGSTEQATLSNTLISNGNFNNTIQQMYFSGQYNSNTIPAIYILFNTIRNTIHTQFQICLTQGETSTWNDIFTLLSFPHPTLQIEWSWDSPV